jgi:hypothetical protein
MLSASPLVQIPEAPPVINILLFEIFIAKIVMVIEKKAVKQL